MRRITAILLSVLFLLPGCRTKENAGRGEKIQDYFADLQKFSFGGTLRTDYGDRVIDFGLDCAFNGGEIRVAVTSPEYLRGVAATLKPGSVTLEYDSFILETGQLPGTGLSPLEIIPFMLSQWGAGYVTSQSAETLDGAQCHRMTFAKDNTEVNAWFSKDNAPIQCELIADGALVARLSISDFSVSP
ncbi:MAG: hypothetical protein LBR85_06240 [Oscillospiraceae bacterium]|jgi:hypothetical protein|nr:hypothetical protein [Oscillospiraceae bacterium]